MASAVILSRAPSREFIPGVSARPAYGVGERVISVGISAALFGLPGLRRVARVRALGFRGDQMTVAAQHLDCVAAPRVMKCFEQARKEALGAQPGSAFGGSTHH